MTSLNDLDAQLAALEGSVDGSTDESELESEVEESPKLKSTKKRTREVETEPLTENQAKLRRIEKEKECIFRHVSAERFTEKDKMALLKELRLRREFDPQLGEVVKKVGIPTCRSFKKTGKCEHGDRCRFWHIDSELMAKWAGFPFWCGVCRKGFTSEFQLAEHNKSKPHKNKAWAHGG